MDTMFVLKYAVETECNSGNISPQTGVVVESTTNRLSCQRSIYTVINALYYTFTQPSSGDVEHSNVIVGYAT